MPIVKDENPDIDCLHVILGTGDTQINFGIAKDEETGLMVLAECYLGFAEYKPVDQDGEELRMISTEELMKQMPPVLLHFTSIENIDQLMYSLQLFKQKIIQSSVPTVLFGKAGKA